MCGICGYVGSKYSAASILREMLVTMEKYRLGYESVGIAAMHGGKIILKKNTGGVDSVLPANGNWSELLLGNVGIGHVRYPSPKAPTGKSTFAHPFLSCDGEIALVHNGTIHDYKRICSELSPRHHYSSYDSRRKALNDSEVIVHLLEEELTKANGDAIEALNKVCRRLTSNPKNQFLFAFIHLNEPARIYLVSGKDFENKRKVAVAFKEGFGSMFASYRDEGIENREPIKFEALRSSVNLELDRVEVLRYGTLAVLTREGYQLIPLIE